MRAVQGLEKHPMATTWLVGHVGQAYFIVSQTVHSKMAKTPLPKRFPKNYHVTCSNQCRSPLADKKVDLFCHHRDSAMWTCETSMKMLASCYLGWSRIPRLSVCNVEGEEWNWARPDPMSVPEIALSVLAVLIWNNPPCTASIEELSGIGYSPFYCPLKW